MVFFVTGIDTEIGKTIATGLVGAWLLRQGQSVITCKMVQTGCHGISDDIRLHRQLMENELLSEDDQRITCPGVYPFPASPHLAAELAGQTIDVGEIIAGVDQLAVRYDTVLVEGAGGLMVPLSVDEMTIDIVGQQKWPVILVTAPRLGSINHTLLSLEALRARDITLAAVIYNLHFSAPPEVVSDTRNVISRAIANLGSRAPLIDLPDVSHRDDVAAWNDDGLRALMARGC